MKTLFRFAILSVAFLTFASVTAWAVSTRSFVLDQVDEFKAGDLDRTAVHSNGTVTGGVDLRRLPLEQVAVAYTAARGPGGVVYVGTGNDGRIYRLQGERLAKFAETRQMLVSALVVAPDGTLYAGTIPQGRIYKVDAAGRATEFCKPEGAEHIWALSYDARRRMLFAATGPDGKVFSINTQGRATVYYDASASHILSMALGPDGTLYAGTSEDALLLKLAGPGRATVVHDFPGNEIAAIALRGQQLGVAVNQFAESTSSSSSLSRPSTTASPRSSTTPSGAGSPTSSRSGKGRLWRIGQDGRVEQVFANDEAHFTSVQWGPDDALYVGAAKEGRAYRVTEDRTHSVWIDVDERQVLYLDLNAATPFLLTGDSGALYRILATKPRNAVWTSKVLDAEFPSRFGQLTWRAEGTLEFQTRSGNTAKPDTTWSDWSPVLTRPSAIRSPNARFLQIRARFARQPAAVLRAATVYYLPQNQRPFVSEITAKPQGGSSGGSSAGSGSSSSAEASGSGKGAATDETSAHSSVLRITWKADAQDGDRLRHRVYFRAETQDVWRPVFPETEELTKAETTWDTSSVPDGYYRLQVIASDEPSNPPDLALRTTVNSAPVLVDNHAPRVDSVRIVGGRLQARVVDEVGPITRIQYSLDGGDWMMIFPADSLLDTRDERVDFRLSTGSTQGPHVVAVRAYDAAGNVGSAEVHVSGRR